MLNEILFAKPRTGRRAWALGLGLLIGMICLPKHAAALTALEHARIEAISEKYDAMSVRDCVGQKDPQKIACNGTLFQLRVNEGDLALKAKLKDGFHVGDYVNIDIKEDELQDLRLFAVDVSAGRRILVMIVCALVLLGFATAVTKGAPLKFIVGEDNRYSNSKFQVAVWFWVLISSYLAIVVLRVMDAGWDFLGRVNIPQNLLLVSGLSALTFGGAKAITTAKANAAAAAAAAAAAGPVPPAVAAVAAAGQKTTKLAGTESLFHDLLQNDSGHFDFGDFQMLVVTLIAVGMYVTLFFNFLGSIQFQNTVSLPDLDTTILASFGLGQGAYLTKKAAGNPGTS